ncbi:uncharacterized protein TRAVEDRAFT_17644 [Trametes versicolor FP-101664 SS1]|uniref:uncharacterized protein n=1 Tax=Trametes versicolor (strain FP-101664) TaxID=717944 RepID=UPI0004623A8F|nr:uncharacterized protein TRAVEDRAFT_17644 [Trametes versicolor FP-101664 SS1]EIW63211.1 hypothetical protein TRAVEDRAFT_17644 [Trametes versicolor FP-101664 SS1]
MDTLPPETLQRIFELACTDGGHTGNALSRVSKAVRELARTARFHSVALAASPRRLHAFVRLYTRECEGEGDPARGYYKPRIQHLHVAFPRISRLDDDTVPAGMYGMRRARSVSPPPRRSPSTAPSPVDPDGSSDPTASPEYLRAAQTLFRLAAPDLATLVVQCGFTAGGALHLPVIAYPFPHLREAAFVGVADPRTLFASDLLDSPDRTQAPPLFPAMTHLYVVPPWGRGLELALWAAHAPQVAHLGVSGADDFVDEIARAVGVRVKLGLYDYDYDSELDSPSPVDPAAPVVPTYPSVRHLLLQIGCGPINAPCGNAWDGYEHGQRRLREVVRGCEATGVEVVEVAAPAVEAFGFYYERARQGWLERIEEDGDGAGCWADMVVSLDLVVEEPPVFSFD